MGKPAVQKIPHCGTATAEVDHQAARDHPQVSVGFGGAWRSMQ